MMEELPQREEEAAEGAEAAQALRDVTQEIRKRDEEKVLDDEEQEAEEKGAGKEGQAGSAPPAGESVGGGAAAAPPLSETVAVEREQEQPDHEEGVEEEGEFISLVQQPEAVEEDAGVARLFGSRGVEESGLFVFDRVHHTFCFSPPKRGRKLSNEDQVKMKRSKSPERKDEQQAEQAEKPAWYGVGGD